MRVERALPQRARQDDGEEPDPLFDATDAGNDRVRWSPSRVKSPGESPLPHLPGPTVGA
jgi:hypothetical protein